MKNKTAKQIKATSGYELGERLNCLHGIMAKLDRYSHVFEADEKLCVMVQDEINGILEELDARETAQLVKQ
jgi:hypothetical protein